MVRFECSAILFDLDGVLVDSAAFIELQWRRWALARGRDPEAFVRVCHGRRAVETVRLAAPDLDAEAEVAAFDSSDQCGLESLRPVPGAGALLAALRPHQWAVATSGPRESALIRLRQAGLLLPEVLVAAEDVVEGKPSPEVYRQAAARLRVAPGRCLVVEDSPPGLESARRAGIPAIALTTTHPASALAAAAMARDLRDLAIGLIDDGRIRVEVRRE